jgi:hypothetical protein
MEPRKKLMSFLDWSFIFLFLVFAPTKALGRKPRVRSFKECTCTFLCTSSLKPE